MEPKRILIPKYIEDSEPCLRCLTSPLQYNFRRKKFNPNAVLPPPDRDRNDVSLSRLKYIASIDVCIARGEGLRMGNNTFCGIASFTRKDVSEVNEEMKDSTVQADIEYAPMHADSYVDPAIDVYVDDPNVDKSDHAELRYCIPYNRTDVVNTQFRAYANALIKKLEIVYLKESV